MSHKPLFLVVHHRNKIATPHALRMAMGIPNAMQVGHLLARCTRFARCVVQVGLVDARQGARPAQPA